MELATREGPYRSNSLRVAAFAPSLRFVPWVGALFTTPAAIMTVLSMWWLVRAPTCSSHPDGLGAEAALLFALAAATIGCGVFVTRRATVAVQRRVRVRSWIGKTFWTVVVALPTAIAAAGIVVIALYFNFELVFLRCFDFGGIGSFN